MVSRARIVFALALLLPAGGIALASLRGEPRHEVVAPLLPDPAHSVTPEELAAWVIEGRRDFALVDMRSAQEFARGSVRDAVHCGSCHENRAAGRAAMASPTGFVDLSKKLVLLSPTGREPLLLPKLLADNPRVFHLDGGYDAWRRQILAPVVFPDPADAPARAAAQKREAVRAFFAGEVPAQAPAQLPVEPVRRKGAHKGAAASEGC